MIKKELKKFNLITRRKGYILFISWISTITILTIISVYLLVNIIPLIDKYLNYYHLFCISTIVSITIFIISFIINNKIENYIENKNIYELLDKLNKLKSKLNLDEKYYESLYYQIDLVLENNEEVILEKLPEYKKLFDKKLEIQNQEIKDLYNQQEEFIKQKIELNDFLVKNIYEFENKIYVLKKEIAIEKQNLIIM